MAYISRILITHASTVTYNDIFASNVFCLVRARTAGLTVDNQVMDGVVVRGHEQNVMRCDYGVWTCRNIYTDSHFTCGVGITSLGQFGGGDGVVGPILIEDFVVKNSWGNEPGQTPGDKYRQGDGIICNRDSHNVTLRRGVFNTGGDGGLDVKSYSTDPNEPAVILEDIYVKRFKRGIRPWGNSVNGVYNTFEMVNVQVQNTFGDASLHINPNGGDVYIDWENPDGRLAIDDYDGVAKSAIYSSVGGYVQIALRDLTYSRDPSAEAVDAVDNTSLGLPRSETIRIQSVTGSKPNISAEVDGSAYGGGTINVSVGVTKRIDIVGAPAGATISMVADPGANANIVTIDPDSFDVTFLEA